MPFDPYCRLYLQSSEDLSTLIAMCARVSGGVVSGWYVNTADFELRVEKNDDFDEHRFHTERRFVFARYTAEVTGEELDVEETAFVRGVCDLVVGLRNQGTQVAVASEFEDEVADKTGWNWSESTREHPPVETRDRS